MRKGASEQKLMFSHKDVNHRKILLKCCCWNKQTEETGISQGNQLLKGKNDECTATDTIANDLLNVFNGKQLN